MDYVLSSDIIRCRSIDWGLPTIYGEHEVTFLTWLIEVFPKKKPELEPVGKLDHPHKLINVASAYAADLMRNLEGVDNIINETFHPDHTLKQNYEAFMDEYSIRFEDRNIDIAEECKKRADALELKNKELTELNERVEVRNRDIKKIIERNQERKRQYDKVLSVIKDTAQKYFIEMRTRVHHNVLLN